jgi:hypothetical protein
MNGDYVYPSIFFSYFLFFMFLAGGIFFFIRSLRDGYWGSNSEEVKYIAMLGDDEHLGEDSGSKQNTNQGDAHARS